MQPAWTNAPDCPIILGLRLRPLQLGHIFALENLGLTRDLRPNITTAAELLLAIFFCSQDHDKSRAMLPRVTCRIFLRLWAWKNRKADLLAALGQFEHYLADHLAVPKTKIIYGQKEKPREFASPWQWRLLAGLMQELHIDEQSALALPIWRAHRLWCAVADAKGTVNFWTDADQELFDYRDKMEAAKRPPNVIPLPSTN